MSRSEAIRRAGDLLGKVSPFPWHRAPAYGDVFGVAAADHAPMFLICWDGPSNPADEDLITEAPALIRDLLAEIEDLRGAGGRHP